MNSFKIKHILSTVVAITFFAACSVEGDVQEPIIDPIEKTASLAVVDVSGQANIANELRIDGLLDNKTTIDVGSADRSVIYEQINAGLRRLTLDNYQDTIRLNEHNYYTLMIYDSDSLWLSLDAPYGENQFQIMPQVRWNMTGAEASDYLVNITSDSVLRNIPMNEFIPVTDSKAVEVSLYHRDNVETLLGKTSMTVGINKKVTVNILVDKPSATYDFTSIVQSTK